MLEQRALSRAIDARYAIYLAPPPDADLWRFGSALLGYDAASAEEIAQPVLHGIDPDDWRAWTARPSLYGFHATLKAPFRLAPGHSPERLCRALEEFCVAQTAFALPPLIHSIVDFDGESGFLALIPDGPSEALAALERQTVIGFDPFRAEPTEDERLKRDLDRLSERQRAYFDHYGYPAVLDEFRLHFSLTARIRHPDRIAPLVSQAISLRLGRVDFTIDALVLFEQAAPDQRFRIAARFPFGA
jgi:Protein of unknown function (DUF1045)